MASNDLDRTRPVDCTEDPGVPAETMPTMGGLAIAHYGKPFGELTRRQQREISTVIRGHRAELEEYVRSLKTNNLLTAHERIERMAVARDKMQNLMNILIEDAVELVTGDDMDVSETEDFKKTRAGTIRRNLRHMKVLAQVQKSHVETEIALAKLEDKQGAVFVKEGDKHLHVDLTPDDFKAELDAAIKGELVDQSGDGNVCGDS